jgi:hypothetical protein
MTNRQAIHKGFRSANRTTSEAHPAHNEEFARREILPLAARCDREAGFTMEVAAKAREIR